MKRSLLLTLSIILLTTTVRAQDTTRVPTQRNPSPHYRIFMFSDQDAASIFNMMGTCPEDIKGDMSLKEAKNAYAQQFNHPAVIANDTASSTTRTPAKKKKK